MDSLIKFCAKDLVVIVVLIFIYAFFKVPKKDRRQLAVALIIAIIIAGVLDKLAGKLFYDPRPFVSHNLTPLVAHAADNGFPSEHTLGAMVLSTILYFYDRKLAGVSLILTIVIGSARVAAHVHSPIDIIGGLALGLIASLSGYYLANRYFGVANSHGRNHTTQD